MTALRTLLCLVSASSALVLPVAAEAQVLSSAESSITFKSPYGSRAPLGLNLGRSQAAYPCGSTTLFCDSSDRADRLYANTMIGKFWGVEMGYLDAGRAPIGGGEGRTQGLNLSLVGKAPLGQSLRVYGKLGATYGRDTSLLGASALVSPEQGFGLSYGAGVSFAFTPRLSATLEWDSNDFRLPGAGRDPVRSTSLGLQYRY